MEKNLNNMDHISDLNRMEPYFTNFERIRPFFTILHYAGNTALDMQKHNCLLFLLEGEITITALLSNGRQSSIWKCNAPILLGDMEFFGDKDETILVHLLKDSTFASLPIKYTKPLLMEDPKFLYYLGESLARKLSVFADRSVRRISLSVSENVAEYLLRTCSDSRLFCENLKDTSAMLNISYRHLLRELARLTEDGILERNANGYLILDKKKLQQIANGEQPVSYT